MATKLLGPRDHFYDQTASSDSLFSLAISRALNLDMDLTPADLRAPPSCALQHASSPSSPPSRKPKPPTTKHEFICSPSHISLPEHWSAAQPSKASASASVSRLLGPQKNPRIALQKNTYLNLSTMGVNADADHWILPDFEEWEIDADGAGAGPTTAPGDHGGGGECESESELAPLVKRAVNSNRERLRRRLEGDGWDFVGGKYGDAGGEERRSEDGAESAESAGEESSVDEEFDVVVLDMGELAV